MSAIKSIGINDAWFAEQRPRLQRLIDSSPLKPVWRLLFKLADARWLRRGGNMRRRRSEASPRVFPGVEVEPTNWCNAKCTFCAYQHQDRPKVSMSHAMFKKLVDEYSASGGGMFSISPFVGENLMDRGYVDKVRYAASKPNLKFTPFTTNAILLTREKYEQIATAGVGDFYISISGLSREEYLRIYRVDKFDEVMANLIDIAASPLYKRGSITLNVRTDTLFPWWNKNWKTLKRLGYKMERLVFYDNWGGSIKSGDLSGWMFIKPRREDKREVCAFLYGEVRIFSDGRISACGCRNSNADAELVCGHVDGGLHNPNTMDRLNAIRARFESGDLPKRCQECREYRPSK